jgi:DNA-binding NarL/FixJ family response regulator
MHLGLKTIESYRNKIFEKTGVKNMAGLAVYAIRAGIYKA